MNVTGNERDGQKGDKMAEEIKTEVAQATTDVASQATKTPTFDDVLKDKAMQSEFDKRIAKAIETSKTKWEQEAVARQNEAERLAKMTEAEKHAEELKKIRKEKDEALAKLNAYELKSEAQKIASEKGMDYSLLDIIDYSKETAETVKEKIETIYNAVTKATEKQLNDRLKQPEPKQVTPKEKVKKEVSRASF